MKKEKGKRYVLVPYGNQPLLPPDRCSNKEGARAVPDVTTPKKRPPFYIIR
jgi:hypothetical protein